MELELTLNDEPTTVEADRSDLLLDALRRNGYTGAKRGCDTGACGMCNVVLDGEVVQSCVTPVTRAEGADLETIEGLGTQDDLHPIQQAFVDRNALQCGFCIPGMIMSAKHLLAETPDPEEGEVREALEGNLCRCTGYKKPVEAVLDAADRMAATDGGEVVEEGAVGDCAVEDRTVGDRAVEDRTVGDRAVEDEGVEDE